MPEISLIALFARPLNSIGISYAVTGSMGATYYGEPRFTNDIDLVIDLQPADIGKFRDAYSQTEFSVPQQESLLLECTRSSRGHSNIIHFSTGLKADCYFASGDPLQLWAVSEAKKVEIDGEMYSFARPEYVIVKKLDFYRQGGSQKHLRDIQAMLKVSGDLIDFEKIEEWAPALGIEEIWREIKVNLC